MIELTESNFQEAFESDGIYVVVFVQPGDDLCDQAYLIISRLAHKYRDYTTMGRYDCLTGGKSLIRHFKIRWLPQVIFFLKGKVVHQIIGRRSMGYYEDRIRKLMNDSGATDITLEGTYKYKFRKSPFD